MSMTKKKEEIPSLLHQSHRPSRFSEIIAYVWRKARPFEISALRKLVIFTLC